METKTLPALSVTSAVPPSVAIYAPGLLGGSIALALRSKSPSTRIAVWARRPEALGEIRARGLADLTTSDPAEAAEAADLSVLCCPVGHMAHLATALLPGLRPNALVTDVGSVKAPVADALGAILGERFLGSHPMAGSDQTGLAAARADLFEGAACILTPTASTSAAARETIAAFWSALGCRLFALDPAAHDRAVAWISHLPHITAAALVDIVASVQPEALALVGSGFRDTTRVAAGPAPMWREILAENLPAVRESLRTLAIRLDAIERILDEPVALEQFLARAQSARERLHCPPPQ